MHCPSFLMMSCNLCKKRVQSHSSKLVCDCCGNSVHLRCLPRVDKDDKLYTDRDNKTWFCSVCVQLNLAFNNFDDDDDFLNAILDCSLEKTYVNFDYLMSQKAIFNPFDLNDDDMSPLQDSDPDLHFYCNQFNTVLNSCNYTLEDTFNKKIDEHGISETCFSLIHENIRSAPKNLDAFETIYNP